MDPLTVVALGFMLAQFAYHRLKTEVPEVRERVNVGIPRFEEGTIPPLLYGRVFVQPGVPWYGNMEQFESPANADHYKYRGDVFHLIGIPFYLGDTRLRGVYSGGTRFPFGASGGASFTELLPNLGIPSAAGVWNSNVYNHLETAGAAGGDPSFIELQCEFADGTPSQDFLAGPGSYFATALVTAGVDPDDIPGHRGFATLFCRMDLGSSSIPQIGVEISTYPAATVSNPKVGEECNPGHVIYDLISGFHAGYGTLGKLGVTSAVLDDASFLAAIATLLDEEHGYSGVITGRSVDDVLMEILRQIDGVLYQEQGDGLIKLKLIRADYDPRTIPQINVSNCEGLISFAAAGWTAVVNKVRVVFTDRANNYQNGSASAHNQANAVGQDGEVNEIILNFPGVCTQELADFIAGRELAARSRPLAKFTAIVDRTFYRVAPGDAVSVSWPDANISNMVFRVGRVGQGTADSNMVQLDLIEDYFYVHRGIIDVEEQVAPFTGSGGILEF
jgi:hypothetical protein